MLRTTYRESLRPLGACERCGRPIRTWRAACRGVCPYCSRRFSSPFDEEVDEDLIEDLAAARAREAEDME